MDKIILKNMEFYGYHGLFQEENKLGQRFNVDVELFVSLKQAGQTDQMEDSIDYGHVFNVIKEVVEGKPRNLIERIAQLIADQLLNRFTPLQACKVKVKKPNPPIDGHYDFVAVEIYRERSK